jgi:aryl-alcohol dehydrogenase-like predicted oxidoreductase
MEYRVLGGSGLRVSPLCLGTMMFGGQSDGETTGRIIGSARDAGINFLDTADVYVKGESERIVGRCIKNDRDDWVLATKCGNAMGPGPNQKGLNRKWVTRAVEDSLRRLDTDYVDIYYFHRDDYDTPLEEMISTVGALIEQGKIRHWGVSNVRSWRVALMVAACEKLGVPRPVISQPYYNAMNRMPEEEFLPACHALNIGVVPYSPLARGVLTGKYTPDGSPGEGTRAGRADKRLMETEFRKESLEIAQKIKAHAEKRGMTAGQFAVNWVLNNGAVTSVIAGPRTLEQWTDYLGALDHTFTAEDEDLIDQFVPAGHPSTPGFTDPQYPILGRMRRV